MDNKEPLFNVEDEEEIKAFETEAAEQPVVEKEVKKKKKLHPFSGFLIFVDICAVLCFILAYSPLSISVSFRNWLVTSALGTSTHKYLAYILYDDEMVKKVVASNSMKVPSGVTDVSQIEFVEYDEDMTYENPYEEQILKKDEGNDDYKIFEIREGSYAGFVCVIYDPKDLNVCMAKRKYGDYVSWIGNWNNAVVCSNFSAFVVDWDTRYIVPCLDIISDHELTASFGNSGSWIGMNDDGVLILQDGTYEDIKDLNLKWGTQYGPYLIVNGEAAQIEGNGGFGVEPRTAIGQRKDGIVILVVIDGRGFNGSLGAGMDDLIEIFTRYGCYNAANLDGGGSSTLVENGNLVNSPCEGMQLKERFNVCALCLIPDDEN